MIFDLFIPLFRQSRMNSVTSRYFLLRLLIRRRMWEWRILAKKTPGICRAAVLFLVFLFFFRFSEVLVVGGPAGAGAAEGGNPPVRRFPEPVFDRNASRQGTDDDQGHDDERKGADAVDVSENDP